MFHKEDLKVFSIKKPFWGTETDSGTLCFTETFSNISSDSTTAKDPVLWLLPNRLTKPFWVSV
jgi:hypothetical protein